MKLPYTVIGIALLLLAVLIGFSKLPKGYGGCGFRSEDKDSIWAHRHLLLCALGIFAYVGAEVSIGSFLVNYFELPEIANLPAKRQPDLFPSGAMVGRFIGAPLLQRFKPGYLLAICAAIAGGLVTASMLLTGHIAMWAILAVGLFHSIMFPTIFSL